MEKMFELDVQVYSSADPVTEREAVSGSCFCSMFDASCWVQQN